MIATVLTFLLAHGELLQLIFEAAQKGLTQDVMARAIRDAMVAAADAEMKKDLG